MRTATPSEDKAAPTRCAEEVKEMEIPVHRQKRIATETAKLAFKGQDPGGEIFLKDGGKRKPHAASGSPVAVNDIVC